MRVAGGSRAGGSPRRRGLACLLAVAPTAVLALVLATVPPSAADGRRAAESAPAGTAGGDGGGHHDDGDAHDDHAHDDGAEDGPHGHEGSEGLTLAAAGGESVRTGGGCARGQTTRRYDVVAIPVDVTLNRYLDHDPEGRMYVLEDDLPKVRGEEARNAAAREGNGEPGVSIGLQGDAIQPLTLRVLPGECLRLRLRNDLPGQEPASLHLHDSSLRVADGGGPAIATNPRAMVLPGQTVTYEWAVPDSQPEGTHAFHSHGDARSQSGHGLFGAVIVEPPGSEWLDPTTGGRAQTGWAAIIRDPQRADFREFALYYHEVGHENYLLADRAGGTVPQVDPLTSAYRPGSRALNYRSEPFMNRLALQQTLQRPPGPVGTPAGPFPAPSEGPIRQTGPVGTPAPPTAAPGRERTPPPVPGEPGPGAVPGQQAGFDESVAYSSYAFGDPATPLLRTYLGDPVKERVIHGGSEVFHVHHVHGGATRWHRQPEAEPSGFDLGLDKHPQLLPSASDHTDSQSLGPSETFDVVHECGAGGCQQSAGDFLYHCHVAQHYFAGMWGLWRVYNTLQNGSASTDALPLLRALPDREGSVVPAVTSAQLSRDGLPLPPGTDLTAWIESQLPPPGTPKGYDASVLDWRRQGDLYLNEPEAERSWPGYVARRPGSRLPIRFDPRTGKLAYPLLRPHLGARPPFAPHHGPAPFLDPLHSGPDPPAPGANGPSSTCPAGTQVKTLPIHAIELPIVQNARANVVDPAGQLFVLKDQEDAVRADNRLRTPLAVRANAGEDCVDVVLTNEIPDTPDHPFSKVSAHIHFVQFDVQGSDGVDAGFNYEQSVRPFTVEGETVQDDALPAATSLRLRRADRFQAGVLVGVGMDERDTFEAARVVAVRGDVVVFDRPLRHPHRAGELVSAEFVRQRWYPDVQFGTAYIHDHVNAIASWRHGLVGALVSEPPGASYHDPQTGEPLRSGPVADVHTNAKVSADLTGSFRELVAFVGDDNPLSRAGRSSGGAYNLRVEPLDARPGDPSLRFSSAAHGDPETPLLRAFLGDPVVMRTLVGATNDVHTFHVDGHWFRIEPYSARSPPTSTAHLGISERYDLVIPAAGGPQRRPGDYLYYSGRSFKLREGSWGLLRVLGPGEGQDLRPLPGRGPAPAPASETCPPGAPLRRFDVAAVNLALPMLDGETGKLYVLEADREQVLDGRLPPTPLVLHVNVGDCIEVRLRNAAADGPVSFHVDQLAFDPRDSAGVAAGREPPQAVDVGQTRTYRFYAHPEVGETTALVRDWGDVVRNPRLGLFGAIVVGPPGASYRDPVTGADAAERSSWQVDVQRADGSSYRDFALFLQDEDEGIGTHRMPYTQDVRGVVGINYRSARPASAGRAGGPPAPGGGDPATAGTPVLETFAGDPVRLHVLSPWSEQAQVFAVEGHSWEVEPGLPGTTRVSATQVGGLEALTIDLLGGAGGAEHLPGDYLYGSHREPYREAGMWGVLRVRDPCASPSPPLTRLQSAPACGSRRPFRGSVPTGLGAALVAAVLLGGVGIPLSRRLRRARVAG